MKKFMIFVLTSLLVSPVPAHETGGIDSDKNGKVDKAFDLVHTRVFKDGSDLVFEHLVGLAG